MTRPSSPSTTYSRRLVRYQRGQGRGVCGQSYTGTRGMLTRSSTLNTVEFLICGIVCGSARLSVKGAGLSGLATSAWSASTSVGFVNPRVFADDSALGLCARHRGGKSCPRYVDPPCWQPFLGADRLGAGIATPGAPLLRPLRRCFDLAQCVVGALVIGGSLSSEWNRTYSSFFLRRRWRRVLAGFVVRAGGAGEASAVGMQCFCRVPRVSLSLSPPS